MSKRRGHVGLHAHGCTRCGRRYEDACHKPYVGPKGGQSYVPGPDHLCDSCHTGHSPPWWDANRLPRDCCRAHSRVTREEERTHYRLAGTGPWFICAACHRTFPFVNPAQEQEQV